MVFLFYNYLNLLIIVFDDLGRVKLKCIFMKGLLNFIFEIEEDVYLFKRVEIFKVFLNDLEEYFLCKLFI